MAKGTEKVSHYTFMIRHFRFFWKLPIRVTSDVKLRAVEALQKVILKQSRLD